MFSNSKNNRDLNFDQNNRDYDFFHNRPALRCGMFAVRQQITAWILQLPPTFTFTLRAFSRTFYPKGLTIKYIRRKKEKQQ